MSENTLEPGQPVRVMRGTNAVCAGTGAIVLGWYANTDNVLVRERDHGRVFTLPREALNAQPPPLAA